MMGEGAFVGIYIFCLSYSTHEFVRIETSHKATLVDGDGWVVLWQQFAVLFGLLIHLYYEKRKWKLLN